LRGIFLPRRQHGDVLAPSNVIIMLRLAFNRLIPSSSGVTLLLWRGGSFG